jgi:hypothetical protein
MSVHREGATFGVLPRLRGRGKQGKQDDARVLTSVVYAAMPASSGAIAPRLTLRNLPATNRTNNRGPRTAKPGPFAVELDIYFVLKLTGAGSEYAPFALKDQRKAK